MGAKWGFLPFSEGCIINFPWYCKDCSLGQCLTSCRAKTSWKRICGRNDHFYSNVVECIFERGCFFVTLVFGCFRKRKRESLIILKLLKACNLTSTTYPFPKTSRNCCKSYILGDFANIYTGIHPVFTWLWATT